MKKPNKTTIACNLCGCRHSVHFVDDKALTPTRGDVMPEAIKAVAVLRLGAKLSQADSCVALAALVAHGCDDIMQRPLVDESDHVDLGNWREIYIRWETNRLVERAMYLARSRARRERRRNKPAAVEA